LAYGLPVLLRKRDVVREEFGYVTLGKDHGEKAISGTPVSSTFLAARIRKSGACDIPGFIIEGKIYGMVLERITRRFMGDVRIDGPQAMLRCERGEAIQYRRLDRKAF
jgi:hypothetical protein